jgi:hypothetical protein
MLLKTKFGSYLNSKLSENFKTWYRRVTEKPLPTYELTPALRKNIEDLVREDAYKFEELLHAETITSI